MTSTDPISWRCEVCRKSIADGEGGIWADIVAADRIHRERLKWDAEVRPTATITDFLKRPRSVEWHVVHDRCDPDPDAAAYLIEVDKLRSPWDIISTTSYLMGKTWLESTNWSMLIGGLARDHEAQAPSASTSADPGEA